MDSLEKFSQSLMNDSSLTSSPISTTTSSIDTPIISSEDAFKSSGNGGGAPSFGGFVSYFTPVIISVAVITIVVVALPKIFNINPPAPAVTPPPTPPPPPPPNYQTDSQFCGTSASDAVNCNAYGTGYSCDQGVCRCSGGGCVCNNQQSGGTCSGINQRCTSGGCACNSPGGTTLTYCSNTSLCHDLQEGEEVTGLTNPSDPTAGSLYRQITKCGSCLQAGLLFIPDGGSAYGNYGCCNGTETNLTTNSDCNGCGNQCGTDSTTGYQTYCQFPQGFNSWSCTT